MAKTSRECSEQKFSKRTHIVFYLCRTTYYDCQDRFRLLWLIGFRGIFILCLSNISSSRQHSLAIKEPWLASQISVKLSHRNPGVDLKKKVKQGQTWLMLGWETTRKFHCCSLDWEAIRISWKKAVANYCATFTKKTWIQRGTSRQTIVKLYQMNLVLSIWFAGIICLWQLANV